VRGFTSILVFVWYGVLTSSRYHFVAYAIAKYVKLNAGLSHCGFANATPVFQSTLLILCMVNVNVFPPKNTKFAVPEKKTVFVFDVGSTAPNC